MIIFWKEAFSKGYCSPSDTVCQETGEYTKLMRCRSWHIKPQLSWNFMLQHTQGSRQPCIRTPGKCRIVVNKIVLERPLTASDRETAIGLDDHAAGKSWSCRWEWRWRFVVSPSHPISSQYRVHGWPWWSSELWGVLSTAAQSVKGALIPPQLGARNIQNGKENLKIFLRRKSLSYRVKCGWSSPSSPRTTFSTLTMQQSGPPHKQSSKGKAKSQSLFRALLK